MPGANFTWVEVTQVRSLERYVETDSLINGTNQNLSELPGHWFLLE